MTHSIAGSQPPQEPRRLGVQVVGMHRASRRAQGEPHRVVAFGTADDVDRGIESQRNLLDPGVQFPLIGAEEFWRQGAAEGQRKIGHAAKWPGHHGAAGPAPNPACRIGPQPPHLSHHPAHPHKVPSLERESIHHSDSPAREVETPFPGTVAHLFQPPLLQPPAQFAKEGAAASVAPISFPAHGARLEPRPRPAEMHHHRRLRQIPMGRHEIEILRQFPLGVGCEIDIHRILTRKDDVAPALDRAASQFLGNPLAAPPVAVDEKESVVEVAMLRRNAESYLVLIHIHHPPEPHVGAGSHCAAPRSNLEKVGNICLHDHVDIEIEGQCILGKELGNKIPGKDGPRRIPVGQAGVEPHLLKGMEGEIEMPVP